MKAAVFDVDGTLIDSMEFWNNLGKNYLLSIGVLASKDLNHALEKLTVDEGISYMKERYGIEKTHTEIKHEMDKLLISYYREDAKLKPYVIEMLKDLKSKGIRMAIASVIDEKLIFSVLNRYNIAHYFEFVQTCENTGISKDDDRFYKLIIKNLNLNPEEIFLFEDSLFSMISAKKVGLNVIAVEDNASIGDLEKILKISDIYIRDFNEFIKIVDQSNYNNI